MNINRRSTLKMMATTTGAALVSAAGISLANAGHTPETRNNSPAPRAPRPSKVDLSDLMVLSDDEKIMGSMDAPVTIIEYASTTCPHCASFHINTLPAIKKNFIDTGKAKLVMREFPVSTRDMRSIAAFMLARCADEDKYFPMLDVLYQKQAQWSRAENPVPVLLNISKLAGFTQESFDACLKNQQVMDTVLKVRNKAADNYGVTGTPTFFINGKKHVGNASVEVFSKLIEDAM